MAIIEIKRAAEKLLASITPAIPTAYEGVKFEPPVGLYQRVVFTPRQPIDPVFTAGYHREEVQLQIFVIDVIGEGTEAVTARAELIRDRFKKGTYLVEGSIKVYVLTTPFIAGCSVASDRLVMPILINLTAEVVSS
jgi:hypothetical protein